MTETNDRYAITRIDLRGVGTHGWQVRFQRRGRKFRKFFADGSWGGKNESYRQAKAWRDQALCSPSGSQPRICGPSGRNSSGVVGVSKITITASNGSVYYFWQATWCPAPGRRRCVRFSVQRHGDRTAFKLAVDARETGVQE